MTDEAMKLSLPKRTMKSRINWKWSLGLALAVLPVVVGFRQDSASEPVNTDPAVEGAAASEQAAAPALAVPNSAVAAQTAEDDVVDAPAKPISTAKPLPPGVRPTAPVAEVLRLADSGVEESVMLAFVTNSTSTFNLGAEEIIYLTDLGVPSAVVTAMIQRDQALRELSANSASAPGGPAPAEPTPSAPEPAPAPVPADMAPQPDYTTGDYAPPADSTYATFYDSLAPYGTWVDVEGYGPCWQPTVVVINPGWQPYCNGGYWTYTDCGWYWLSGYSWGWAPFHYGRWFRHSHRGWCWQPGGTWGPSWVCWRYGGNYCGWAPLPPAAGYRAGVGLTFHGQRVSGSFGFGLGVNSFSFVEVSHFSDRHLHRYAMPRQHAAQVYHQTAPSTSIVGNRNRVVNRGIPVSRVETATHTQIRKLGIREVNSTGAPGLRSERLEANSRTLSVFRPRFPESTGMQPAAGGRAQPGPATSSAPAVARPTSDPAPRSAAPLYLHGPDRYGQTTGGSGANAINHAPPRSSLIVIGKKEGGRSQTTTVAAPPVTQTPQTPPTAPPQNTFSRPAATQGSRPLVTTESQASSPARWSTPRAAESRVRTERPQQYAAPSYSAPAPLPRSAPVAVPAPRPAARSYSPPAASSAPRAAVAESRPAYSPPAARSAPPPSSAPAPSRSSSGRNGR